MKHLFEPNAPEPNKYPIGSTILRWQFLWYGLISYCCNHKLTPFNPTRETYWHICQMYWQGYRDVTYYRKCKTPILKTTNQTVSKLYLDVDYADNLRKKLAAANVEDSKTFMENYYSIGALIAKAIIDHDSVLKKHRFLYDFNYISEFICVICLGLFNYGFQHGNTLLVVFSIFGFIGIIKSQSDWTKHLNRKIKNQMPLV